MGLAPGHRLGPYEILAICGETERARKALEDLHALSRERYVDPVTFALIHIGLGETDEPLRWYEKAFSDRTPNIVYASTMRRNNPGLAGNPRFEAIVRKMGFGSPAS